VEIHHETPKNKKKRRNPPQNRLQQGRFLPGAGGSLYPFPVWTGVVDLVKMIVKEFGADVSIEQNVLGGVTCEEHVREGLRENPNKKKKKTLRKILNVLRNVRKSKQ